MAISSSLSGWLDRVAALSKREQVLVGLAVVAVLYLAADRLSFAPSGARLAAAEVTRAAIEARVGALSARVQAVRADRGMGDLVVTRQRELAELTAQIEATAAIRRSATEQPLTVGQLIKTALKTPNARVVVDGVKALPATEVLALEPSGNTGTSRALFRQGVDVQVRGGYADLVSYLQGLERDPRIFWSGVQLATVAYPELTLRLTIHTLTTQEKPSL